jgi:hypothetical protein
VTAEAHGYALPMEGPDKVDNGLVKGRDLPRESLGNPGAVAAARERTMSERLELALSWNAVAAELRAGLAKVIESESTSSQR